MKALCQLAAAGIKIKDLKHRIFNILVHLLHQRIDLVPQSCLFCGIGYEMNLAIDADRILPLRLHIGERSLGMCLKLRIDSLGIRCAEIITVSLDRKSVV